MAEPVPFPPPGFDDLSVEEKIKYLQSLLDRIAATPETMPVSGSHREILEERPKDLQADPDDRERLIREQAAIDARLRLAAIVDSSDEAIVAKKSRRPHSELEPCGGAYLWIYGSGSHWTTGGNAHPVGTQGGGDRDS